MSKTFDSPWPGQVPILLPRVYPRLILEDVAQHIDDELKCLGADDQRILLCSLQEDLTKRIGDLDKKARDEGPVQLKTWPFTKEAA